MDKGQIVECGTHSDLMDKQALYHSLVTAQTLVDEDDGLYIFSILQMFTYLFQLHR